MSIARTGKIDVEGWELEVLQGFGELLDGPNAPKILFEHSPYRFVSRGVPKSAVLTLLTEKGYTLTVLHADGTQEAYQSEMVDNHCDIMASK